MTFITGSVSNANPGPTLYALIETAALALGYTLVDTVTIGGNTHKVLKSAGASGGNSQGLDWYLDINYPTTGVTGGMRFVPFEGYNASTHVATNGPFVTSSTTVDQTAYSRFGATTSALETNWLNTASNGISATLTTAFTYYVSITRDRITVLLTSDSANIYYGGFFTPVSAHSTAAGAALFPLIATKISAPSGVTSNSYSGTSTAAVTRAPGAPTGSWFTWSNSVAVFNGIMAAFAGGQLGGTGSSPFAGSAQIAPIPVNMGWNSSNTTPPTSGAQALVGYLADLGVGLAGATNVVGNTVTIGSDTWYSTALATNGVVFLRGV